MIIYGYREARLSTKVFDDGFCTHCGQQGTIACTVFSKHAHCMWIPLFPLGKRAAIWCRECGTEYKLKEVTPVLQNQISDFKRKQKAPFWQWIGLLLLLGIIASTMITGYRETRNTKRFLETPALNDVYCVKYDNAYSLMYIADIQGDSIFFLENKYTMSKQSEAIKLHRPHFYDLDSVYGYSHDELKTYYNDKLICTIWRNLPYQTTPLNLSDDERQLLEDDEDDDFDFDEDEEDEDEEDESDESEENKENNE